MIQSKEDLKEYLSLDAARYDASRIPLLIRMLIGDEEAHAICFLKVLRLLEYRINTSNKMSGGFSGMILWFIHRRQRLKYGIHIAPNKVEAGLKIYHYAGGIYLNINKMGKNCSVTSGVVCGNKNNDNTLRPTIGDNVDLTVGCKIIGNINIGDNVLVAPNSVVVKDIPNNTVVSGIPAVFLKNRPSAY